MNNLAEIIYADAKKICQKVDLSELYNKTIILTGASGLIGVYFLACLKCLLTLSPSNLKVYAIMQFNPPKYLEDLIECPSMKVILGDITDDVFLNSLPRGDYIIHAAGYGQPGRFMQNQIKTLKINTNATFSLFEKLLMNGKFLFISTSELYSGLNNPPFKENQIGITNTTHVRSCYIEGKRCGEAICNAYLNLGIQAKSARLSLAYGPGTRPGDKRVLNSFIERALKGTLILQDQGTARRTYCYVSDAVEIMWNILLKGKEPVYNAGGISKTTIRELAEKIADYLKVPVEFPNETKGLDGAPDDVYLDMSLVRNEFNKTDFVSFDDGLNRTIEWQKLLYNS